MTTPSALQPPTAAPARAQRPHEEGAELDALLRTGGLHTAFQPIVDLDTRTPVAFEALARGPEGSALRRPDALFAAARRAGRLAELDRACQAAALRAAAAAGLTAPWTLFLNTEPETAGRARPPALPADRGPHAVVVELTERALTTRPAELLQMVDLLRSRGWGIALDDVGADPASLALLPLVRPDVIKLDLRLVQVQPDAQVAAIVNAVSAQAERDGALVLAEGIETEEQYATAVAFGASLGQGWLFGRPGPLTRSALARVPVRGLALPPRQAPRSDETPFAMAARRRPVRVARKPLLVQMSKQLEQQARSSGEACVVVSTFQEAVRFTPATARRYTRIAASAAFVAAIGRGMPVEPVPGVRGADIAPGDPLLQEWDVTVLGPHFAGTLLARDLGDRGPEDERRFEFVISHDRDLVVAATSALLTRISPLPRAVTTPVPAGAGSPVSPAPVAQAPAAQAPADLSGRAALCLRLQDAVDAGRRTSTACVLLLVAVDGDGGAGELPDAVTRRLRTVVRPHDGLFVLAPGVHAMVLVDVPAGQAEAVADRVSDAALHALEAPLRGAGRRLRASIGASLTPTRATSVWEALAQAEHALGAARAAGGDCARIWSLPR